MDLINVSQIKKQAAAILADRKPDYRKLVLSHSAVSVAFLVIVAVIGFLLNQAMSSHQGLSGMGNTAILQTAQTFLSTAGNILLPFWELGVLFTSICVVRREQTDFYMLTRGFRRWGVVIRYFLLYFLILMGLAMICTNAVMVLVSFLPAPPALSSALNAIDPNAYTDMAVLMEDIMKAMEQVPKQQLMIYLIPMVILYVGAYGTLLVLLSYRFRFAQYLLLDDPASGARESLRTSSRMTKGEKWNLFKLDLSFWWYYLLQILILVIAYIPDLLIAAGVQLPINGAAAGLIAYIVYAIANLALVWLVGAYYQTSIACAYETLRPEQEESQPQ